MSSIQRFHWIPSNIYVSNSLNVITHSEYSWIVLHLITATAILEEVVRILRKKELLEKYLRWIILPQLHSLDLSLEGCEDRNKPVEKQMFEHLKCASLKCSVY
jgi:hypothetical protein